MKKFCKKFELNFRWLNNKKSYLLDQFNCLIYRISLAANLLIVLIFSEYTHRNPGTWLSQQLKEPPTRTSKSNATLCLRKTWFYFFKLKIQVDFINDLILDDKFDPLLSNQENKKAYCNFLIDNFQLALW